MERQCPDGLRYNQNVKLNINPCQFPADVKCPPGSSLRKIFYVLFLFLFKLWQAT